MLVIQCRAKLWKSVSRDVTHSSEMDGQGRSSPAVCMCHAWVLLLVRQFAEDHSSRVWCAKKQERSVEATDEILAWGWTGIHSRSWSGHFPKGATSSRLSVNSVVITRKCHLQTGWSDWRSTWWQPSVQKKGIWRIMCSPPTRRRDDLMWWSCYHQDTVVWQRRCHPLDWRTASWEHSNCSRPLGITVPYRDDYYTQCSGVSVWEIDRFSYCS